MINDFNLIVIIVFFFFGGCAGMAFGTGSAVAHRAVDAVMGPRVIQHENVDSSASASPSVPSAASNVGGSDVCSGPSKAMQDVGFLFSMLLIT